LLLTAIVGSTAAAQTATVTGKVTNDQGQPIAGANVFIQTLNIVATANAEGNYNLSVPNGVGQKVMLGARFIGFVPHTRPVTLTSDAQTQNFTLKADPFRLEEVVVTGVTGETSAKKLPISVSHISEEQIKNVPAGDPVMALAGKVPGAKISSGRGNPGANPTIRLRGSTNLTTGGSTPMILVDGVITQTANGISDIDANDIESIEVLKGAAAASFYGSSAANGVINIRTKRGKDVGDNHVSYTVRSEYGQSGVADFGKAPVDQDPLGLSPLGTIDCDFPVFECRHVGRVSGEDSGITFGAGYHDHVDVGGHDQPVGCDKLEMEIGHLFLTFDCFVERLHGRFELVAAASVAEADDFTSVACQAVPPNWLSRPGAHVVDTIIEANVFGDCFYASCASFSAFATASSMPPTM